MSNFTLHQTFKACGKKWAKRAAKLAPEQLEWMLQRSHQLHRVSIDGRTLATIEVLSTPSFRDCDVANTWSKRETTVRLTYHLGDGTTRTRLSNFAADEVFFNQQPSVYPHVGRILLRGVDRQGRPASRWLNAEHLKTAYEEIAARPEPVLLAAQAPASVQ